MTGVALVSNATVHRHEQAERERALLTLARTHHDQEAAAELLFFYTHLGVLSAPDVQEAVEEGMRDVVRDVLAAKTVRNGRLDSEINVLSFFGIAKMPTRTKERKTKDGVNPRTTKQLELRHAFGVMLTWKDLSKALTTDYATTDKRWARKEPKPCLPREEWAETLGEAEEELIVYVRHLFKDADMAKVRAYVRASYDWLPWDTAADGVITYPRGWERLPA